MSVARTTNEGTPYGTEYGSDMKTASLYLPPSAICDAVWYTRT